MRSLAYVLTGATELVELANLFFFFGGWLALSPSQASPLGTDNRPVVDPFNNLYRPAVYSGSRTL